MADTQNALGAANFAAEVVLFCLPDWTVVGSETNAAVTATAVAVTGKVNMCYKAYVSFSGASGTAANTFTIKDGSGGTVLFQAAIPAAVTAPIAFDFSRTPIRATRGNALVAALADPGAGVTGTITIIGITRTPG